MLTFSFFSLSKYNLIYFCINQSLGDGSIQSPRHMHAQGFLFLFILLYTKI